jgi:hypothetical protein
MATWELEDELKLQFPMAPAWGHAGSQGGGDVRDPSVIIKPTEEEQSSKAGRSQEAMSSPPRPTKKMKPNKKTATSQQGLVREMKPTRVRKPNSKYYGSDWVA